MLSLETLLKLFFIPVLLFPLLLFAQQDTLVVPSTDSLPQLTPDSLILRPTVIAPLRFDSLIAEHHPFYQFTDPVRQMESKRIWRGKEDFFYVVVGLLLFFAFVRHSFSRYIQDLFRLFFRTTVKQRQAKDHLTQSPFPSLLMNILFTLSGGLFIALVFRYYKMGVLFDFWELFVYCAAGLAAIYMGKFVVLKIFGWVFGVVDATDAYTFIIFTTNKIIGAMLLPFIVILALTTGGLVNIVLTLSFIMIGILFIYRYFLAYSAVHRRIKFEPVHFVLYLSAFEIIPLLLINKLLFQYLA